MSNRAESIVDATGLILGRMASIIAKRLLQGERIAVVNAEKAVISGRRKNIIKEAKKFLEIGHFRKGPYHPRSPDRIVKRTVRGMLPRGKSRGREALKRLRVYAGLPDSLRDTEKCTLPDAKADKLRCAYITVSDLAEDIGWTGGVKNKNV